MSDHLTMKALKEICDAQAQRITSLDSKVSALETHKRRSESACGILSMLTCWTLRRKNELGLGLIALMIVSTFSHWGEVFDFSLAMLMLLVFCGALEYGSDTLQEKYHEAVRKLNEA